MSKELEEHLISARVDDRAWIRNEIESLHAQLAEQCDRNIANSERYTLDREIFSAALQTKDAEVAELRKGLDDVLGHSNCYCDRCADLSRKYYTVDENKYPLGKKPDLRSALSKSQARVRQLEEALKDLFKMMDESILVRAVRMAREALESVCNQEAGKGKFVHYDDVLLSIENAIAALDKAFGKAHDDKL